MAEEETKQTEKPLEEMSVEDIQTVRDEIAAEEFEDSAEVKVSPEPKITPEIKPDSELKKEPEPEKKELKEDPWTGVSPALRKTFEDLSDKVSALDTTVPTRLKQTESRLGAMQNEFYAAKKVAEETTKKVPTEEEIKKAATEKEEWEELRVEYPDWAMAMDNRLAKQDEVYQQRQEELAKSHHAFSEQVKGEFGILAESFEKKLLTFKYPNWDKTIVTPEYLEWIAKQPANIRELTFSPSALDACVVLDQFSEMQKKEVGNLEGKETPAEIVAKRKERLRQSISVDGIKTQPSKAEADMTDAELRKKYADEIWAD